MSALHVAGPVEFVGEIHPYADRWPMSDPDELEALAASIAANGQRFPIVLDPDGRLIDGRNRLAACTLADVAPMFTVDDALTDEDAIGAYIWDVNGERRDMSKGQKAMLAALRPGSTRVLSTQTDVTNGYINRARQVIQWCDDDTIANVCGGLVALNDAYEQAQQIKATEQAEEIAAKKAAAEAKRVAEDETARLAELRKVAPEYAALVDSGQMTVTGAQAAYLADTKKEREAEAARREAIRQANVSVTEATFRLHLLAAHPEAVAKWLDAYDPAQAIHPLDRAVIRDAITTLTALEAGL